MAVYPCEYNFVFHISLKCSLPFLSLGPFDSYRHTLTLAGSLMIKNGNSSGSVSVSERRILSHKEQEEVSLLDSDNEALLGRRGGGSFTYVPSLNFKTCCFAY